MICKLGLPVVSSFAVGELLQGLLGCIHLSDLAAADELYMVWEVHFLCQFGNRMLLCVLLRLTPSISMCTTGFN